jgi:fructose-1,6-bisphosphatase/inositol monophosphatase family enzyme
MKRELLEMAKAVAKSISSLPFEERGIELCMGADGTPTSKIDKVAEDAILNYLGKNNVELNVLSEEAGFIDRGADMTLVMDPIDGTINASRGIPIYSVSLAIGKHSLADLEEGLVYNLVSGDAFYAAKGKGAHLNDKKVRVSSRDKKGVVLMAYTGSNASPRHRWTSAPWQAGRRRPFSLTTSWLKGA